MWHCGTSTVSRAYGWRMCTSCGNNLPRADFSNNQWLHRGVGGGCRCKACVAGHAPRVALDAVRRDFASSTRGLMDKGPHFAMGTFRLVARGVFLDGEREGGQNFVAKWFKSGMSKEEAYFAADVKTNERALSLLASFCAAGITSRTIRLNDAEVWCKPARAMQRVRGRLRKGPAVVQRERTQDGKLVLVEPYIHGYEKFNSNSGWTTATRRNTADVMSALSHFSYHISGGQYLLCDLQGSSDDGGIILSDVVINSREAGRHGPADLGPLGISTFFSQHRCGRYCSGAWTQPEDTRQYLPVVSETSMTTGAQGGGGGVTRHETLYEEEEEDYY